jgi:hypothetical protein
MTNLTIGPETRIAALLEAYPGLEDRLVDWAPVFAKLKHPILRKTVAKAATLEQVARVSGVGLRELVLKLREATGQTTGELAAEMPRAKDPRPAWVDEARVRLRINADALLQENIHPLGTVRASLEDNAPGEMVCVASSFYPAPLIDLLTRGGCTVYSEETAPGRHLTYIRRD